MSKGQQSLAKKINLLCSMLSFFCMLEAQSTILFILKEVEVQVDRQL